MVYTVQPNAELDRIKGLEERTWDPSDLQHLADGLTQKLKTETGTMRLLPLQAQILAEAEQAGGAYVSAGVGSGKTLAEALIPEMLDETTRPLLLVPASLRLKTHKQLDEYREHFKIRHQFPVITYELIQQPNSRRLLEQFKPNVIIADEPQNMKNEKTARARRFLEYFEKNRETKFFAFTGSPTEVSVLDFWYQVVLALKDGSPVPLSRKVAEQVSEALDSRVTIRRDPGVLRDFATGQESAPDELGRVREAFQRRLRSTWGFIATTTSSCNQPLDINLIKVPVGEKAADAIETVRQCGETPNGEVIDDKLEMWATVRQLANGFFYYFDPPPPEEWLRARRAWRRFVLDKLENSAELDSPKIVEQAYSDHPLLLEWQEIEPIYDAEANRTWMWVDTFLLDHIARRLSKEPPALVWTDYIEVGQKLAEKTGLPYYQGGSHGSTLDSEKGNRSVIVSLEAHREGHNLQAFNRNIFLSVPQKPGRWEQAIGRTHREGQTSAVINDIYQHVPELEDSWQKAVDHAKFVYETTGQPQKILIAKHRSKKLKL